MSDVFSLSHILLGCDRLLFNSVDLFVILCKLFFYTVHEVGFLGGSDGKASARNAGDLSSILGREDLLEKEMAAHSSTLA